MKKIVILFATMMLALPGVFANRTVTADELFKQFGSAPGAESVSINPLMVTLGKIFTLGSEEGRIVRKVKSVKVLELTKCAPSEKNKLADIISNCEVKNMQPLVVVTDNGENIKILAETKGDRFKKVLLFVSDTTECALIQVKGNFRFEDLTGVVNSQIKRNK